MLQAVLFEDLPNGIDTLIGDSGVSVSGGQRQRIALARAILRDPEVLILDEATSALDYISRSLVNDAIRLVRQGKTTIVITHDVSVINDMDFAYVMKDGQIVQNGFKKDLINLPSGHFAQMASALNRVPQAPAEPILPAYSLPAASFSGVKIRQSDGLWRSHRASVFGGRVSIAPRPLTMTDGDLMSQPGLEEYWSCAEAGEATALKRLNANMIRAPAASIPEEPEKSEKELKTVTKEVDTFSEKEVEAVLKGDASGTLTIWQMLKTTPRSLSRWQFIVMILGFAASIGNGAATPIFGFTLSQLMSSLFTPGSSSQTSLYRALGVLGVSAFDGLTTYLKTYLLESVAEKWVHHSRQQSIKRVLKQDCEWFLRNDGQPSIIAARVINSGEEMRHILGRFAGNIANAVSMLALGIIWALVVGWELTLIGLALTPVIFFSTKMYVAICSKTEGVVVRQVERSTCVLQEATRNIKAVQGLGLEEYFEEKFGREVLEARNLATRKVFWIGAGFGFIEGVGYFSKGMLCGSLLTIALMFWYGAHLVSQGKYSVTQMLTVFTLIIFSTTTAAQTMKLGNPLHNSSNSSPSNLAIKRSSK
jgi:ABC-type multidrug transport system fused ATPase/permease subunit